METDDVVGRVLSTLRDTALEGSTLVFFTSDNGCSPAESITGLKYLESKGHFPSGPLRGYKQDVWEGGHRMPFIVRWPSVVMPGRVCNQLVHQADLMATLAEILGIKLPDNAGEDSFSLLPLLRGDDKPIRENAVSCSVGGIQGVRQGPWKLICDAEPQLFNLASDLGETRDLAAQNPERVAELLALRERLVSQGRSTPGTPQKNDVEVRRRGVGNWGKAGAKRP
jgi:arylsulfatase A